MVLLNKYEGSLINMRPKVLKLKNYFNLSICQYNLLSDKHLSHLELKAFIPFKQIFCLSWKIHSRLHLILIGIEILVTTFINLKKRSSRCGKVWSVRGWDIFSNGVSFRTCHTLDSSLFVDWREYLRYPTRTNLYHVLISQHF